jgi:acetoin utilization protein AcuB
MTVDPVTLSPGASAAEALALCREHRIRHVPVLEGGRLVGIVSDRDLRDASPPPGTGDRAEALRRIKVEDVMSTVVVTAHPQDPIGYVAQEMYQRKVQGIPVLAEESPEGEVGELLGIVTSSDVMQALVELTGVHESGSQVEVKGPDRSGIVVDVAAEIRDLRAGVVSVLSVPDTSTGGRHMLFRLSAEDPSTIVQSLEVAGYSASWVNVPKRPRRRD